MSTLGFRYFFTFIDYYSRYTWLFLMINRAELFFIFQKFYAKIQTQFSILFVFYVVTIPWNIFLHPFTSFMSKHGILHQFSCTYTPKQNGVDEHKNCHLVEIACTLLLQSHVSFRFWGCILTNKSIRIGLINCIILKIPLF